MTNALLDIYSVLWADLRFLCRNWRRIIASSLMSPVLYLVAFGFGLGRGIAVDGARYIDFVIPGIIALTSMTSSFSGAGMKLNVDRLFYGCFDEYLMSPISPLSLITGKAMIGVVRGLLTSISFLVIGIAISPTLQIRPLFVLSLLLSCFTFSFLGELAALVARSHQDMATFNSLAIMPMAFLGGTFFSLEQLPGWLRVIMNFIPLSHSSQCLRTAALGQPFPWLSLLAIAAFCALFFLGCVTALRRNSA
jgi:ABC-type multidrug transport system permease subunit